MLQSKVSDWILISEHFYSVYSWTQSVLFDSKSGGWCPSNLMEKNISENRFYPKWSALVWYVVCGK